SSAAPRVARFLTLASYQAVLLFSSLRPHRVLLSFPTRRSSDLNCWVARRQLFSRSCNIDCCCRTVKAVSIIPEYEPVLTVRQQRSEEHTSELQSRFDLVCRLLLAKKNQGITGTAM